MTQQTEIPGTETPTDTAVTPELDAQVHGWLDAKDAQVKAATDTKLRHTVLLVKLAEAGVQRYPYTDRATGKKHYVVVARDPKAKTIKAPKPKTAKQEAKADKAKEKREKDAAETVEQRTVSRESVADEIDPFARTRQAMGELAT